MFKRRISFKGRSQGFTLVELLVAVTITAIIGSALTMTITQFLSISIRDKNRMEAVKQVENALHYLNRDIQMSHIVEQDEAGYFPLRLSWQELDDTNSNYVEVEVTYSVEASGELKRTETKDGDTRVNSVAFHIDDSGDLTTCTFDPVVREATVKVTAAINGFRPVSETRTLQVLLRSLAAPPESPSPTPAP